MPHSGLSARITYVMPDYTECHEASARVNGNIRTPKMDAVNFENVYIRPCIRIYMRREYVLHLEIYKVPGSRKPNYC